MGWRAVVAGLGVAAAAVASLAIVACGGGETTGEPAPPQSPSATTTAQTAVRSPSPPPSATRTTTPTATPTAPPGTVAYMVVAGDTLFSLARRFSTTVEALMALNGITDPEKIRAGDTLLIPVVTTATVPPRATATAAPMAASIQIDHGSRSSGLVALTFDLGGRVEPALDIMNWLTANHIAATIFVTGAMADNQNTDVGRQVLQIIDANPGLFELGNHSDSHPDFRTLTADEMRSELTRTETSVARHSTSSLRPLFRPPFGGVDAEVLAAVGAAGYRYTIMWDVDTIDWRPEADGGPSTADIVTKVLANAQGGSIVLMHLGGFNTLEALPRIVDGLRARGLQFAKVSTLLP